MAEYKPVILVNSEGCEHTCETPEQYAAFIAAGWHKPKASKGKQTATEAEAETEAEDAHKAE